MDELQIKLVTSPSKYTCIQPSSQRGKRKRRSWGLPDDPTNKLRHRSVTDVQITMIGIGFPSAKRLSFISTFQFSWIFLLRNGHPKQHRQEATGNHIPTYFMQHGLESPKWAMVISEENKVSFRKMFSIHLTNLNWNVYINYILSKLNWAAGQEILGNLGKALACGGSWISTRRIMSWWFHLGGINRKHKNMKERRWKQVVPSVP